MVNNFILKDTLEPYFYRFCFLRIIYMIKSMCIKCPSKRRLIWKTDLYAAYHCIHANLRIVSMQIDIVDKLYLICLRLTFVTTPAPVDHDTVSEAEIDLGNDLLEEKSWDAIELQSPHIHLLK